MSVAAGEAGKGNDKLRHNIMCCSWGIKATQSLLHGKVTVHDVGSLNE